MDRRAFFSLSAAGAVALGAKPAPAADSPRAAGSPPVPPLKARLGHQVALPCSDAQFAYVARYGVEGVGASATIADPAQQPAIAKKAQSRNFIVPSAGRLRPRLYSSIFTNDVECRIVLKVAAH